jgi:hypothetical protein
MTGMWSDEKKQDDGQDDSQDDTNHNTPTTVRSRHTQHYHHENNSLEHQLLNQSIVVTPTDSILCNHDDSDTTQNLKALFEMTS